jgi:hypothetical protein
MEPNRTTLVKEVWPFANVERVINLGRNLVKFKSDKGVIIPEKRRLFAIIVSAARHLTWNLRLSRVVTTPDRISTVTEIHNQWLKAVDRALQCDHILTDKIKLEHSH